MKVDFVDLKPSIFNALIFFLYAMVVIPLGKFILLKYQVPGLSQLAASI